MIAIQGIGYRPGAHCAYRTSPERSLKDRYRQARRVFMIGLLLAAWAGGNWLAIEIGRSAIQFTEAQP